MTLTIFLGSFVVLNAPSKRLGSQECGQADNLSEKRSNYTLVSQVQMIVNMDSQTLALIHHDYRVDRQQSDVI